MCHVNCHVHIYGILPKKIIKILEKACQNYYNYNLIKDIFPPFLFGHAKALVKVSSKYPGKSLPSQERRMIGTNQTYLESLHKSWLFLGSLGPFQPAERQVSMDC